MTAIEKLRATVAALRDPVTGCPWDIEQTHQSLCACLIDECSELLDTIDRADIPHMREELGDVLLQVVMHAQLAAEAGNFTFDDVAADIDAKLVRRHPHVFGDSGQLRDSAAVLKRWDEIKAAEKAHAPKPDGPFKHLPPQLPALRYAHDVYKQIRKKNLPADGVVDVSTIDDTAAGLTEAQAGRALFNLAAACRVAGIDPESALRRQATSVQQGVSEQAVSTEA